MNNGVDQTEEHERPTETDGAADSGQATPARVGFTSELRNSIRAVSEERRKPLAPLTAQNTPPPLASTVTPAQIKAETAARAEGERRERERLQRIAANPAANLSFTPQELLRLGIDAAKAGERKTAFERLTMVVKLQPDNSAAWLWLGAVLEETNPERALECVKRSVALDPNSQAARRGLATVQAKIDATNERKRLAEEERLRLEEEERQHKAALEAEMQRQHAEEVARREAEMAEERERQRLLRPQVEQMPTFLRSVVGEVEDAPAHVPEISAFDAPPLSPVGEVLVGDHPAAIDTSAPTTQIAVPKKAKKEKPKKEKSQAAPIPAAIHMQATTPMPVARKRRGFFNSANVRVIVAIVVGLLLLAALAGFIVSQRSDSSTASATPVATLDPNATPADGTPALTTGAISADTGSIAPTPTESLPTTVEGRYVRGVQKALADYNTAFGTIRSLQDQTAANKLAWPDFTQRFKSAATSLTDTNRSVAALVAPQRAIAIQQQLQTISQLTKEGVDLMNNGIANIETDDIRAADARFTRATSLLNDLAAPVEQLKTDIVGS